MCSLFFFFNDTATTEIYTLSLHDALPICTAETLLDTDDAMRLVEVRGFLAGQGDRKSTRLNSSHSQISYAVFCLKKKKEDPATMTQNNMRLVPLDFHSERSTVGPRIAKPC